jgi:ribosomal protein S18 acetylase RimI-like enzyme
LRALEDWEPFLLAESRLPSPRANLELVQAVEEEADEARALQLTDAEEEFLVMCGAVALGRHVADGRSHHAARLRELAVDPRWRVREGVAMALQRWGHDDFDSMATEAERCAEGSPLEQRAAIVALSGKPWATAGASRSLRCPTKASNASRHWRRRTIRTSSGSSART